MAPKANDPKTAQKEVETLVKHDKLEKALTRAYELDTIKRLKIKEK